MDWKEFFKPDVKKVLLAVFIMVLLAVSFMPVKVNVDCEYAVIGASCLPVNSFIKLSEISSNPGFAGINYFYLIIEVVFSYLAACILTDGYKRLRIK